MADPHRARSRTRQRLVWLIAALGAALSLVLWRLLPRGQQVTMAAEPAATGTTDRQQDDTRPAFEPTDWVLWPVAAVYVGVVVLLVVSCFVLIAAYRSALPDVSRALHIAPPGPQLQTGAQADLSEFRAQEEKRLNTYYWIDRRNGIVHIPIAQAIKKLAATGVPGFPKASP